MGISNSAEHFTLGLIMVLLIGIAIGGFPFSRTVEAPTTGAVAYPAKAPAESIVEVSFLARTIPDRMKIIQWSE